MVILLKAYYCNNKMLSRFLVPWQLSSSNIFPQNRFSIVFFKDKLLSYCLSEHCQLIFSFLNQNGVSCSLECLLKRSYVYQRLQQQKQNIRGQGAGNENLYYPRVLIRNGKCCQNALFIKTKLLQLKKSDLSLKHFCTLCNFSCLSMIMGWQGYGAILV